MPPDDAQSSATDLTRLLTGAVVERDGVWVADADLPDSEPWSGLARVDPVHAVVSAADPEQEATKTAAALDVLLTHVRDGDLMVDMGCGYGRLAKYLLPERVLEGYIGVDVSPVMLDLFATRHAATPLERRTPLLLVHSSFDALHLDDCIADVAVFSAVLLHQPKAVVARAVAEAHRILKPGGKLVVLHDFPNQLSLTALQGNAYLALLRHRGQEATSNGPVRYYREREVRALLEHFARVEITHNGYQLFPKSILGLSPRANHVYRRYVHEPGQRLGLRLSPTTRARLYLNLTAIATK